MDLEKSSNELKKKSAGSQEMRGQCGILEFFFGGQIYFYKPLPEYCLFLG